MFVHKVSLTAYFWKPIDSAEHVNFKVCVFPRFECFYIKYRAKTKSGRFFYPPPICGSFHRKLSLLWRRPYSQSKLVPLIYLTGDYCWQRFEKNHRNLFLQIEEGRRRKMFIISVGSKFWRVCDKGVHCLCSYSTSWLNIEDGNKFHEEGRVVRRYFVTRSMIGRLGLGNPVTKSLRKSHMEIFLLLGSWKEGWGGVV